MPMTSSFGITGYGGYVPRLRIPRSVIASAHQWMAPHLRRLAKGQRAFCSWDEDSVTMAVEAARDALGARPRDEIRAVHMVSTTFPYADLQHSPLLVHALGLDAGIQSRDSGHSQRAGASALLDALQARGDASLVVASDAPRGKPASVQELSYGAGAAAFTLGSKGVLAELIGSASHSDYFVDHFRAAGQDYDYFWEERWIRDEGYLKQAPPTIKLALESAGITPNDVKRFILASSLNGIASAVAKQCGLAPDSVVDDLDTVLGHTGAAHPLVMLAHVLETASPGDVIVVVGFGQGTDVLVLRACEAITEFKPRRGVSGALSDAVPQDAYLRFLSFSGGIDLEWGMRAEKSVKTALTEQYRSMDSLASFTAGKSPDGTVQFPQLPYSVAPGNPVPRSEFEPVPLADEPAKVLTITSDWLSYHPAPPLHVGFIQFENGARLLMETVDVGPAGVDVGTPVRMVFRVKDIDKTRGYARYFWKATPISA